MDEVDGALLTSASTIESPANVAVPRLQLPAAANGLVLRHAGGFALVQFFMHNYLLRLYVLLQLALFGNLQLP